MAVSITSSTPSSALKGISTQITMNVFNNVYSFSYSPSYNIRYVGGVKEYEINANLSLKLYGSLYGSDLVLDLGVISGSGWYREGTNYLCATFSSYITIPNNVPNDTYYLGGIIFGDHIVGRKTFTVNQSYSFVYNGNGVLMRDGQITRSVVSGNPSHTILGSDILSSRKGYYFDGWALNSSGTGTLYDQGDSITASDQYVNLYAKWTPIVYNVNLMAYSGSTLIFDDRETYTYSRLSRNISFTFSEFGWHRIVPGSVTAELAENQPDINGDSFKNITQLGDTLTYHIPPTSATHIDVKVQLELADAYINVEYVTNPLIYQRSSSSQIVEIPLQEILTNGGAQFQYKTLTGLIGINNSDISGLTITKTSTHFRIEVAANTFKTFNLGIQSRPNKVNLAIVGGTSDSSGFKNVELVFDGNISSLHYNVGPIVEITRTGYVQAGINVGGIMCEIGDTIVFNTLYPNLIAESIEINATIAWEPLQIYITFDAGFGGDSPNLIAYNGSLTVPNAAPMVGKTFEHYTLGIFAIFAGSQLGIMQIIKHYYATNTPRATGYEILSLTTYRNYKNNYYTVTAFNDVGSTNFTSRTFTIDTTSVTLPVKTKPGYNFNGYSLKTPSENINGSAEVDNSVTNFPKITLDNVYSNLEVEPIFTVIDYNISYNYGGSIKYPTVGALTNQPTSYKVTDPTITFSNFIGSLTRPAYKDPVFNPLQIATGSTEDKNVSILWTAVIYSLTFDLKGGTRGTHTAGTTYSADAFNTSSQISLSLGANPTKVGYTFKGWNLVFDTVTGATSPIISESNVIIYEKFYGNIKAEAQWEVITYTITYDLGGTESYPIVGGLSLNPSSYTIETPTITFGTSNITRPGFSFKSINTTHIPLGSTGNKAVIVSWNPNFYNIVLNQASGSGATSSLSSYSTSQTLTNPLTFTLVKGSRIGYLQAGWAVSAYSGPELKKPSISGDTLTIPVGAYGAFTVSPIWEPITYSIKYGEVVKTLNYTESVGILPTPGKTGYTFDGWYTSGGVKITDTSSGLTATNGAVLELEARYIANSYIIIFDANGATNPGNRSIKYDELISNLPTPTVSGYTFKGWFTQNTNNNGDGGQVSNGDKNLTITHNGSVTLYAKWEATTWAVTYPINKYESSVSLPYITGGDHSPKNASALTLTLNTTSEPGWSVSRTISTNTTPSTSNLSGNSLAIPKGSFGNISISATWTGIQYTITYPTNRTSTATVTYRTTNSSQKVTIPNPVEGGWTLNGMSITTNNTTASGSTGTSISGNEITIPANNYGPMFINATWTANTYTVTYNTNGGTSINQVTYTTSDSNQEVTVPTKVVRDGYTRGVWTVTPTTLSANLTTGKLTIPAKTYGDIVLNLSWNKEPYTFNFNFNGATPTITGLPIAFDIESNTRTFNIGTLTISEKSLKGYNLNVLPGQSANSNVKALFGSHIESSDGNEAFINKTLTSFELAKGTFGGFTITAVWDDFYYKVIYNPNGGKGIVITGNVVSNNSPGSLRANTYTKDRYRFFGWSYLEDTKPMYTDSYTGIILDSNKKSSTITDVNNPLEINLYAYWVSDSNLKFANKILGGLKLNSLPVKLLINNQIIFDKPFNKVG